MSEAELEEKKSLTNYRIELDGVTYTKSYHLPLKYRETERWGRCSIQSAKVLSNAKEITCIQDREGDLYDTFATADFNKINLLIRSKHNRPIQTETGKQKLYEYRHSLPELGHHEIEIRDRKTGKNRKTKVSIKSSKVNILRGTLNASYQKDYPKSIDINVVYVEEISSSVPTGAKPILWVLLTTHSVNTLEEAVRTSYWYSLRWLIEIFFFTLKTGGFCLESSELETGTSLRKMGLLTMEAAIQVLQLKQARDGDETVSIETVFSESEISCLEAIAPQYEGTTVKQQNPFSYKSLPWAAWIIARMGGWTGYKNNRPPGIQTFKNGLDRFKNIHFGFSIQRK